MTADKADATSRLESDKLLKSRNFTTWLKRTLIVVAVLLVIAILFTALGYRKLHGVPDWYALRTMSTEKLAAAAHSAENKLVEMQNWAAQERARESARLHATTVSTTPAATTATRPASQPADTTTIDFTQDELNAFFQKWVASTGWAQKFGKYVSDPAIFLQDGRIILAGTVKELGGTVASVHFQPSIDRDGKLDLRLVRVLGGNLPLPKAVWSSQRDRLARVAAEQLPHWQQHASIAANGTLNLDAVSAGLTEALLHVLHDQPADPVIFLPVAGHGAIPARLTDVSVQDQTLSLTVRPMTPAERQALLARVKGHAPAGSADGRATPARSTESRKGAASPGPQHGGRA